MTQTPTPMDANFTKVNRLELSEAIQKWLIENLESMLKTARDSNFPADFYGELENPTVGKLYQFGLDYQSVVVDGWTKMKTEVDTPNEMNLAYTYLASKGVRFEI